MSKFCEKGILSSLEHMLKSYFYYQSTKVGNGVSRLIMIQLSRSNANVVDLATENVSEISYDCI